MKNMQFESIINGKKLVVECNKFAKQADGSVLVRYGQSVVLVTAVMNEKPSNVDFFPLTVVFQEKLYSVGKIPGGFLKREGKPSEYGTLSARVIDRALRPLFDENFRHEVQVVINVLASDNDFDIRIAGLFGASLSLMISRIPFAGPVSGVLITILQDQSIVINPDLAEINNGLMELLLAGSSTAINMVEASCQELSEEVIVSAIEDGHKIIKQLNDFQLLIVKEVNHPKIPVTLFTIRPEILKFVADNYTEKLEQASKIKTKIERYNKITELEQAALVEYEITVETEKEKATILLELHHALHDVIKKAVRYQIVYQKERLDGRKIDEIRTLTSEIDILPLVHGSALFTRGETQVLSIVTLGALGENQIIDGITDEEAKRFMHHYNFPPFSIGEVGRMGAPSRREIGHGALGEKALSRIIPDEKFFPYTIRIVSEVLESNGSTSQASICASCLALMAAGVPISRPVAGIAMGLIMENSNYTILTDIQGMEDHLGDMDFKVAGTTKGVCALQMDIKINGITKEILKDALAKAKIARNQVLENMLNVISEPRSVLAPTAPKMKTFSIPVDRIREVIGTGGKIINKIIEEADNVKIDIAEDGQVTIYHQNYEAIAKAEKIIKDILFPFAVNEDYTGTVVKIEKFGAFVNLKKGLDGLIHISKLSEEHVEKVEDVVKVNDTVLVKVIGIDNKGKIKLQLVKKLEEKK